MCGCNSSFDGQMEDIDPIEVQKSFSFIEDIESDSEFDDFFGKKARARRDARRDKRRRKRGLKRAGYSGKEARQLAKAGESVQTLEQAEIDDMDGEDTTPIPNDDFTYSDDGTTLLDENGLPIQNSALGLGGMSTTKKVLIGAGIVGVLGLGLFLMRRR